MKKLFILFLVLAMAGVAFAGGAKEAPKPAPAKQETPAPAKEEAPKATAAAKEIKNPEVFVRAAYGDADSLDPCKAYDNASGGCVENLYDTLITYKGSSTSEFLPMLAEQVPTVENGLISEGGTVYKFKIRKGVKFHSGSTLTPEGVAYSFKRNMVTDPDGGPMWMLYEPLFGIGGDNSSRDGEGKVDVTLADLDKHIQVQGDYVVFKLAGPYAPFMAILAGYWSAVVDKDFVIANGGWKGTQEDIARVNGPEEGKETLYDKASGTGPYKLNRWEKGVEVVFDRFDGYWGPKPAIRQGILKVVEEWSTRKLMFLQGDADSALVDPMYYAEMDKEPGLKVYKAQTDLGNRGINFNMQINATDNPYIFSGQLDGNGVPADFFADKDVRLGFCYAFDLDTYLNQIIANAGINCPTPICSGLPFFNPNLKNLPFDLKKAEEHFKKAFGGQLWAKGFQMDLTFNAGNEVRENTMKMIAEALTSLNPKFKVAARAIEWATFVDLQRQRRLPIYYIGWGADYPDPHNFIYTYMHSQGLYSGRSGYNNPEADRLIEQGVAELDPAKRQAIYYRLQDIWLEDNIGIMMHQPVGNHYFRDWIQGFVFHPMWNDPYRFAQFKKAY